MSLSTQEAEDEEDYVLVGRMDNVRNLSNILKAIHFKDVSDNTSLWDCNGNFIPFSLFNLVSALIVNKKKPLTC